MLSIDEVIKRERQQAKEQRDHIGTFDDEYSKKCEVWAEEHEQIANWLKELKVIKEKVLSIPQHFTKEQSDWIKKYCINRNTEFYNMAIDGFVKFASDMPVVETEDGIIRPMWLEEMAGQLKKQKKTCFDCKNHFMSDCYLECYKHERINNDSICDDFE